MGGAVALKVHLKQPDSWDGAILVAPMCKASHLAWTSNFLQCNIFLFSKLKPFSVDFRKSYSTMACEAISDWHG